MERGRPGFNSPPKRFYFLSAREQHVPYFCKTCEAVESFADRIGDHGGGETRDVSCLRRSEFAQG